MRRESTVSTSSGRLILGLMLALTVLVSFMLVLAAQTEAEAQAGDAKEKAANAAEKAKAKAQTSQVKVTTEGSGQTKITVNGQRVEDGQSVAQEQTSLVGKPVTVNQDETQATIQISGCKAAANGTPSLTISSGADRVVVPEGAIDYEADQIVIKGATVGKIADLAANQRKVTDASGITCAAADNGGSGGSGGASAGAGDAQANAGDLTCEQLINIIQNARKAGQAATAQYIQYVDIAQNCDIQGGDVIAGTIPGKTLADTGGMPFLPALLVAGLVLTGGGLLLRATLRR